MVYVLLVVAVKQIKISGTYKNVVEDFQEVVVVTNLFVTLGILDVRLLLRDLIEHGSDQHVDARVRLNELLELFENGLKLLGILLDMIDDTIKPFLVSSVVVWQPVTYSDRMS